MAEVLEWLKPVASTPTGQVVSRSLDVIESALHVYRPEEVCFSFNGGKDSTVVFHMLRAACLRRVRADASIPDAEKASGAASLLQRVRMVYFEVEDNFPEVESFMTEVCATYGLSLQRLPPFKAGLMQLITDHGIRAVLIGTRATDPDGRGLEHFSPTTPGWPPMMRISPILRWDYATVWRCLRGAGLGFCSLYTRGYTSLGLRSTSAPNPALLVAPAGTTAAALESAPDPSASSSSSSFCSSSACPPTPPAALAAAAASGDISTTQLDGRIRPAAATEASESGTCGSEGSAVYLPAWELKDARLERDGRQQRR